MSNIVQQHTPEGYKQTEVGVVPEDWEVKTIGDFAPLQRGFDLPKRDRVNGEYPVVYSNGIVNYHHKFQVKGPGVVTGRSGTIGKVHYVENDYWPHNTSLWVTKFNNAHPMYVYYLYNKVDFSRFSSGSGVPTLNRNDAHLFKLAIPSSKKEQTAIANALSDVDNLITSLDKLIAKKQAIKTGAMQQLLTGKKRLPPFDQKHTGYKQTEIGEIPGDWELNELGDFLKYIQPTPFLVTNTKYLRKGEIPVLTAGKTFILGYTDEEHGIFNSLPAIIFDDFTTATKFVNFPFKAKSSAMKMLIPRSDNINLHFIFSLMQLIDFPLGDHKRHWIGEYQHLNIAVPSSIKEQHAISDVLSDLTDEIYRLEKRLDKTKQLKQGMMQELLTGRTRLI